MGVASWLSVCLGRVGLGRPGCLLSRKAGWLTVSRGFVSRGVVGLPGDWCRRHACCCLLGGGGCPRVPLVCGGGMLSGFWGSAPWLPDSCSAALCGWWEPGVGGLVVNCIVDASILL